MTLIKSTYPLLQIVHFKDLLVWDVKKNKIFSDIHTSEYKLVKISSLLRQVKRIDNLNPNSDYKLLGVKSYGLGVFHREVKRGSEIKSKYLWKLKKGDFVYSRLGASTGSFGLINEEFDNYYVSNEFPSFSIDTSKLNPEFLLLVVTSKKFYEQLSAFNTGSALKRFHEDKFLNLEIPLPSLSIQLEFVEFYNKNILLSQKKELQAKNIEEEIIPYFYNEIGIENKVTSKVKTSNKIKFIQYKDIERWSLTHILKERNISFENVKYKTLPIKKLIYSFDGGKTPSTSNYDYWNNGTIHWVSPKDFNGIEINTSEDKITTTALEKAGMKLFEPGVLLAVFRSGILRHSFPVAITTIPVTINQDLKAMKVDNNIIDTKYLLLYLTSMQQYVLEKCAKVGVTVESVNTDEFLNIQIVVPPFDVQRRITEQIYSKRNSISLLKNDSSIYLKKAIEELENKIFN